MRLIDADALKELFREVIGRIAKKPEMNGNLEHMIRASAMVIQMIDDAPSIQLGTNLAEVGTDLVSRQAMLDGIDNLIKIHFDRTVVLYKARKVAEDLPSIQPERKTGRWIESNPQDSKLCRLMTCSECGKAYIVNINVPYEYWTEAHKFCIECGADMRGEAK